MTDHLDIERETIWQSIRAVGRPQPDLMPVLLDAFIEERRRHFEPEIAEAWQPEDWRDRLRDRFPGLDAGFDHGDGWADLLAAGAQLADDAGETLTVSYTKEKYGRLSMFTSSWFEGDLAGLDDAMESLSEHVCEMCGAPGRNRAVRGWWRTSCDAHSECE